MFCYGQKESWFLAKVRSGKLPAIEFKGRVITESDHIIAFLENEFGALGSLITSNHLRKTRELEREIFRSWCNWLCRESFNFFDNTLRKKIFKEFLCKLLNLKTSCLTFFNKILDSKLIPSFFIPYPSEESIFFLLLAA